MRKNSTSSDESLNDFASRNDGKTWQTVLDQLTNKAIKDGFINEIKKEPGLERKMKRIMESPSLRYDLKIIYDLRTIFIFLCPHFLRSTG